MAPRKEDTVHLLLVANEQLRNYLLKLLSENQYFPIAVAELQELLRILKEYQSATVFLDCETVSHYGAGLYSKIKVACQGCKVVLLCDRSNESHRDIAKEAMDIGIYACLWAPYEGWEVLTLVRPSPGRKPPRRRTPKKKTAD